VRLGLSLVFFLFGLWMLWSGGYSWPGAEHYHQLVLSLGIISCLFVLVLSIRMKIVDPEAMPIHISHKLLIYIPWLAIEIVKANLDVTRHILKPKLDLSPTLFEVEAAQKSELAQVIYANSITLTPGTVSIDVRDGKIVVHALTRDAMQGLIDSDMDRRAAFLDGRSANKDNKES